MMYETYKCNHCGERFDEPYEYVEMHGFDYGPGEAWSECPYCGSTDFDEAHMSDEDDEEEEEVDE